jgi:primosomal protein N'
MAKQSPLYRVDVVPLTPLYGRRDPRFSYASTEPIASGSLVSISFGKRMLAGVTLDCTPLPGPVPEWMKFVGPVLLPGFLAPDQIALAWSLADRLYAPLGIVLKLFFPIQRKPRAAKLVTGKSSAEPKLPVASRGKRKKRSVHTDVWEAAPDDTFLFERLIAFGKTAIKDKRLLCILVPEILAAELYAEKIRTAFPGAAIRTLTSRRTAKEQYETYYAIREHTADILIGTRQTVFAPLQGLSAIVVVDSEKQISYTQWEMIPRYDAIEIALDIARQEHVPFIRLSVAPGISSFLPEAKTVGTPFAFSPKRPLVAIDLRQSYKRGVSQPLSPKLIDALRDARSARQPVLILVKQRGVARFSLCAKCQTPVRCPNCQAALSEAKEGHFRCLSCGYRTTLFPSCKECGHMHFKSFGAGTEKIARDLQRAGFGEHIIVIDRDAQARKMDTESLLTALKNLPSQAIIVATYEAAYSLPLPPLGIIALIEPDQGLFYPDFQSEERLWRELRRFGAKLMSGGTLFVQTFQPEAAFWTTWTDQPLALTAAPLLEERQMLHYPPYHQLILLDCYPKKDKTSLAIAEETETILGNVKLHGVEILPKYLPFSRKNRYHVLIRLPRELPFPGELHTVLQALDPAVHITRNPLSLHG